MQALSSPWGLAQSQLGSLAGLVSNGYEAVPQDPAATHGTVYSFVDSDEFIYDGSEWDDDITREAKNTRTTGETTTNNNSGLDRWGDYSGSWETAESASNSQASPSPKQSPKTTSSPKGRSAGGFWGLFTKQRQQPSRVEPLRHTS